MKYFKSIIRAILWCLPFTVGAIQPVAPGPFVGSVTVSNPSEFARPAELVTIALDDLAVVVGEPIGSELVALSGSDQLPSQLSDTDGDGTADSLLVLVDLAAGEHRVLDIVRDPKRAAGAGFTDRAHVELSRKTGGEWIDGKYRGGDFGPVSELHLPGQLPDHNFYFRYEGPGWESDKIGWRLYLDHRNAIDIFGKRTPAISLPQVGLDGYDSYHEPATWGMDILKVGDALGPGGFGQWDGTAARRVSETRSTRFRVVENGALSAAFSLEYENWTLPAGRSDLGVVIRANAASHLATITLSAPDCPDRLVTGLPKHPEATVFRGPTDIPGNSWTWLASFGKQSLDGAHLGMVIFVRKENFAGFAEDTVNDLVLLRQRKGEVAYHVGAVWEGGSDIAATEAGFMAYVEQTTAMLNRELRVHVKSAAHGLAVDRLGTDRSAELWSARLIDSIIQRDGDLLAYGEGNSSTWNYTTGLLTLSAWRAGEALNRPDLKDWAERVMGSFVAEDGSIRRYRKSDYNIDMINPGKMMLALWQSTGDKRYRAAAEALLEQLREHPTTRSGALWHKQRYPWQVWLDGLYMSAPFMAEAAQLLDQPDLLERLELIFDTVDPGLRNDATGLYHHAWDESREQIWADSETGLSKHFWGRGLGWFAMSLVDTLDYLPEESPLAGQLRAILEGLAVALERWQDPESGMWWQIMDAPGRTGNYREASATSMFVYALAKGVNAGYLNIRYADIARSGYAGLVRDCILQHADGTISLDQICEVAGLGFGRDGSYDYYMSEAVVRNDPKGTGPFILAGLEVARLSPPVADGGWAGMDAILERIQEPRFPNREFVIGASSGVLEGSDISTLLKQSIAECHAAGGGKVVVPAGTYLTGPIHLLSNVNLHLEEGATLLFKTDPAAYLPAVFTRWEGTELMNYSPLIYAFEAENVAITGKGTLDGQASVDNWWIWKGRKEYGWQPGMPEQTPARDRLRAMAESGVPVEERIFGDGDYLRPSFIQPYRCRNVLVEGVTILRSPMWEIHPVLCENVIVRGVSVITHGPNNDGCNPESSRDVLIEDCLFDTGDDCIAIKSGRNADGRRVAVPSENIIIRNCEMRDGHGGVVMGSEISGGCRNIFVENCRMDSPNLDRAIRIKTNSIRGGVVENVYVRNVTIGEVAESVLKVNFLYEEGDTADFTPIVRNIVLENIVCQKARMPLFLVGYARSPIEGITLKNCVFGGISEPSVLRHVKNLTMSGLQQSALPITDEWGRVIE
jgi:unsaturated rhamnogalacturonyl hydrolase